MDRRKLIWLSGLVVGGAVGCAQPQVMDKSGSSAQAGSVATSNNASNQPPRNQQPADSQKIDAKPSSLVQIADVQAQVAADQSRSAEDRQNALNLAKSNYQRAIKLDPNCLAAYQGLARVCSGAGEHEPAIQALDSALAKYPREARLWYERGMVMGREKRFDDAVRNLNQALQIDPSNASYGKSLGLMLARMGRGDEGVAVLQRWMSEADARYNVAKIMEHLGLTAESQRQLQLALRADPGHQASLAMFKGEAAN